MLFVRYFLYIVTAALGSAVLGGAFACTVALVSPDFVRALFAAPRDSDPVRYAAAVGMIWGVFLGAAAMGFCLFLTTVQYVAGLFLKKEERIDVEDPV
jgi:hypothetical protein